MTTLSIGEVAAAAGTSVSALRYYHQLGLITPVSRIGGKRRFTRPAVGRVSFILRAKEMGFTLEEISSILDETAGDWRDLVDNKLVDLAARRERLSTLIEMITEIRECGCEAVARCPTLDSAG